MEETLLKLKEMMSRDYDWNAHFEHDGIDSGIDDLFRKCYIWHDYQKGNRKLKTYNCGSVGFKDTPKTLYRILWLLKPNNVDFSDMYKTGSLIDFTSPDYRFLCSFQLYKYEASLYFGCPKEYLIDEQAGQSMRIECGIPGVDNGVRCSDKIGNLFFEVATMVLNYKHLIYGGNDFEV